MDEYLVYEPTDEDLAEFGGTILSVSWCSACNALYNYDASESRPDDAL